MNIYELCAEMPCAYRKNYELIYLVQCGALVHSTDPEIMRQKWRSEHPHSHPCQHKHTNVSNFHWWIFMNFHELCAELLRAYRKNYDLIYLVHFGALVHSTDIEKLRQKWRSADVCSECKNKVSYMSNMRD